MGLMQLLPHCIKDDEPNFSFIFESQKTNEGNFTEFLPEVNLGHKCVA